MAKLNNIKLFAHDAASANVVLAYVYFTYKGLNNITAYPKGPAVKIFKDNMSDFASIEYGSQYNFSINDIVITGLSGILSNYELEIIRIARACKVFRIISLLDVPRSLDDRFIINNFVEYLPDKILAPTRKKISKYKCINDLVEYKENMYWKYIYEKSYKVPPKITNEFISLHKDNYVVFFTEYIMEQFGDSLGYNEFSVIEIFFDVFQGRGIPILVKLHPSEKRDKYKNHIPINSLDTHIVQHEVSTQQALYYSKAVFGCMTSVFYEALLCNKKAYSLQFNGIEDKFELTINETIKKIQTKKELQDLCLKLGS